MSTTSIEINNPVIGLIGMLRRAILPSRVQCLTVSNALLKSREKTRTNGFVDNSVLTVWKSVIRVAVEEPVGRKANWSEKWSPSGG